MDNLDKNEDANPESEKMERPEEIESETNAKVSHPEPAIPEEPEAEAKPDFNVFDLSEETLKAIAEMGYTDPLEVQTSCIKPIREGRDALVRSRTGTGKTAAFAIPLVEMVEKTRVPQVLVLTPTRELAAQVAEEFDALIKYKGLHCVAIYGGASMKDQLDAIQRGVEFVVGTPGRLLDHQRRGSLDFSKIKIGVLDEADEMLSMGFFEEVSRIMDSLPKDCQTLLFSATLPKDVEQWVQKYLKDPLRVELSGDEVSLKNIINVNYFTHSNLPKPRNLLYLLSAEEPESAIIFCNTRDETNYVSAYLRREGLDAEAISGEMSQSAREAVMGKIKKGKLNFMVATDLAARGIDITDLNYVINYSMPQSSEQYIHRVGRTGRLGKMGTAVNLIDGREIGVIRQLKLNYKIKFEERTLPTSIEYRDRINRRGLSQIAAMAATENCVNFHAMAERIIVNEEAVHIVSYLLKKLDEQQNELKPKAAPRKRAGQSRPEPSRRSGQSRPEPSSRGGRGNDDDRSRESEGGGDKPRRGRKPVRRDRSRDGGRPAGNRHGNEERHPTEHREANGRDRHPTESPEHSNAESRPTGHRERIGEESRQARGRGGRRPRAEEDQPNRRPQKRGSRQSASRPEKERPQNQNSKVDSEAPEKMNGPRLDPGQVQIHLNIGLGHGFKENDIVRAIVDLARVNPTDIKTVETHHRHSYFTISEALIPTILDSLRNKLYEGVVLRAEVSKGRGR